MSSSIPRNAICPDCQKLFTYSGLSCYLAQIYSILCVTAQIAIEQHGQENTKIFNADLKLQNEEHSFPKFQGNFFGDNYEDHEFRWVEDNNLPYTQVSNLNNTDNTSDNSNSNDNYTNFNIDDIGEYG